VFLAEIGSSNIYFSLPVSSPRLTESANALQGKGSSIITSSSRVDVAREYLTTFPSNSKVIRDLYIP
jgi:hypothetical protein